MFDFENTSATSGRQLNAVSHLSVSGGGLLGVIPAAMLQRYETLGRAEYGSDYRLADSFDGVTGSSTGAVIAAGIALGLPAQDIVNFYLKDVPLGFKRRKWAVPLLHDLFDSALMETFFDRRTQGRTLVRDALACDLTILTKDLTRGRTVAFTTMPCQQPTILGVEIRREAHPLTKLLRASTAAPGLFTPVDLTLDGAGPVTLVDGGFSLFNDPAFLASRLARASGASHVKMTALGTGSAAPANAGPTLKRGLSILRAMRALFGLIKEGEAFSDDLMRELAMGPGADLTYRRHDMCLSRDALASLDGPVSAQEARAMRKFAAFSGKERLFDLATRLAETTITEALPLVANKHILQASQTSAHMDMDFSTAELTRLTATEVSA